MTSRRNFLQICLASPFITGNFTLAEEPVYTVNGKIHASALGKTLIIRK
jgi:hypothetical protein